MPRDISGNYTLPAGNPVVTNTLISSVWGNTTLSDIGSALTNSLDRTGVSAGMTGQFKAAAGAVGAPGISWQLETTSGFYRIGAGDFGFSIAGTKYLELTSTHFTFLPVTSFGGPGAGFFVNPNFSFEQAGTVNLGIRDTTDSVEGLLRADSSGIIFGASTNNSLNIRTNNTNRVAIAAAGNVTINAPSSGIPLSILPVNAQVAVLIAGAIGANFAISIQNTDGVDSRAGINYVNTLTSTKSWAAGLDVDGGNAKAFQIRDITRGAIPLTLSTNGNVTIAAPASGTPLTVNCVNSGRAVTVTDGTQTFQIQTSAGNTFCGASSASTFGLLTSDTIRISIASAGNVTINAPSSGSPLTISGTTGAGGFLTASLTSNAHSTLDIANNSTGTAGAASLRASNSAHTLEVGITSTGFSGAWATNMPTGESSYLIQGSTIPLGIGMNNAVQFLITSGGVLQGLGPVAAAMVDMTPDKGSWTSTLSGPWIAGNNITVLLKWERMGNLVTIWTDATATQTATLTTILSASGLPASITPTSVRQLIAGGYSDGVITVNALCHVNVNTNNTLTISGVDTANAANPTSVRDITLSNVPGSGVVGLNPGWSITYSL